MYIIYIWLLFSTLLLAQTSMQLEPLLITESAPAKNAACVVHRTLPDPIDLPQYTMTKSAYPALRWPLADALHDDVFILNYYDNNRTSGIFKDYEGGNLVGYDQHDGTDFGLYSFREMDRGYAIVAPASGVVTSVTSDKYDRNYGVPYPDNGNGIWLQHDDGSQSYYWHLRTNSAAVAVGESVEAGTFLGYIGSSGWSPQPHLHMTTLNAGVKRDQFHGACNPLPDLWAEPEPYVGDGALEVFDIGTFTQSSIGGNVTNLPLELFREKPVGPHTFGINENGIGIWVMARGGAGHILRVELRRPDDTLWSTLYASTGGGVKYGWWPWWLTNINELTADDYGTWTASVRMGGEIVKEVAFELGDNTIYAPRLWRVAGRSFRIDGGIQKDTMRVYAGANPAAWELQNAPAGVTIEDSIVTIPAVSNQTWRSYNFQAVVTSVEGLTDTMWYHLVDMSKPMNPAVGIDDEPLAAEISGFRLAQNFPNPFNPITYIEYEIVESTEVALTIFDLLGREVRQLVAERKSPGIYRARWDGRDGVGKPAASGVYIYRLVAGGRQFAKKMVLMQ